VPKAAKSIRPRIPYRMIGQAVIVDEATKRRLIDNLLDARSYQFDTVSGCLPHWDVAYSFRKGSREVAVVICLHCGIFDVITSGDQRIGGTGSYISSGALQAGQSLFPNDEALKQMRTPFEN
jgi:hypothetical protein